MVTVSRSTRVAAAPAAIWETLADFAGISRWAPNVDHACLMSEQDQGVGMRRRIQSGRTTVVETVTKWEPELLVRYLITGLPSVIKSVTNTWQLERSGDATAVTLTTEVDAGSRPPQQVVAKVVARKLSEASEQMLAGLQHAIEGTRAEEAH